MELTSPESKWSSAATNAIAKVEKLRSKRRKNGQNREIGTILRQVQVMATMYRSHLKVVLPIVSNCILLIRNSLGLNEFE